MKEGVLVMRFEEYINKPILSDDIDIDYKDIFDIALNPICIAGIDAKILKINLSFAECLGYSIEEVEGQSIFSFIHPDDIQNTIETITEHINKKAPIINFENRYKHKNGSYRWFSWISKPIFELGISYSTAHDITHIKEQEEELRKKYHDAFLDKQNKLRYMKHISNHLLNPLQGIIGFSELLKEEGLRSRYAKDHLDKIMKCSQQLIEIAHEIREISNIDGEQIIIRNEWVYLNLLLDELYSEFNSKASTQSLKLILEKGSTDSGFYFHSDQQKLTQILSILISTAIESTPNGTITIGYQLKSTLIKLYVFDTGKGLDKTSQKIIFERSFTSNPNTVQGAGFGLNIANSFVKKLGGDLKIKSKIGSGTRFTITLPFSR